MLEEVFQEVYTKFKLHFYQSVFQRFATREATLTTVESFCMEGIMAMGEPTIAEFSRMMGISTPNAAYKIGSLVRKGYVEKIQSTVDRREYHLRPTQKYINYYNISYSYLHTVIERARERFSPEDARSPEQLAATLAQFSARYDAHKEDKTAPYAGIPELLDTLRANGIQCAVFSNKADAFCGKIIDHYFGTGRFDAVRGSRPGVPTKPDPAGLYALMEQIHADPAATLFVGDSDVDILTGHNAHLPAMGALWGFRGRAELTAAGADALAAVPEDIWAYIQERNK